MTPLADLCAAVAGARLVAPEADVVVSAASPALASLAARPVARLRDDSRLVEPGDLFFAVPGSKRDGRGFIEQALARGAHVIVSEAPLPAAAARAAHPGVAWVEVPSARKAVALMAARHFGAAGALCFTGVTGTNGKTTLTYLMEAILAAAGRRPAVVGTVSYRFADILVPAPNTTPGALFLQGLLAEMQAAGATDVSMEVTSHALDQDRVGGCRFRVAGLTNVTLDHLDYHGTMERYFGAKEILFRELLTADGVAVLFADREDGRRMRPAVNPAARVLTVSLDPAVAADVRVVEQHLGSAGTRARLATPWGPLELDSPLVGDFNLANLCLAAGMGLGHGLSPDVIAQGLARQRGVPGRLERVGNEAGVLCVVDYAHTPDALERALGALRPLTAGRLLVVFGCGGDRDPSKRPVMGQAAARLGDLAFVTSDNPRTEDPARIVEAIVDGVERTGAIRLSPATLAAAERGFVVEVDRRAAIRRAVNAARAGDTVLIAGKGHEDYQILGTEKVHFDDREEARAAFAARAGGGPA
jgi:UDP-N-acetylmuramoyl-L-alanyl-D-glutamate--2,6-diaminopimelate ligase